MKIQFDPNLEYQQGGIVGCKSSDPVRVVFGNNKYRGAVVKTNAIQILKQGGIDDVKSL